MKSIIDIGSNTLRLVIFEENNQILTKKINAGLAGHIDDNQNLSKKGQEKLINSLLEFKKILSLFSDITSHFFATASLRNIKNSEEILELVYKKTGIEITLLTGKEEAIYAFLGAKQDTKTKNGLMLDIGGGSTEIVFYDNNELKNAFSIMIGSLNLYKNYVLELIPNKTEVINIQKRVLELLNTINASNIKSNDLCCIGGSARAISNYLSTFYDVDTKNGYNSTLLKELLEDILNNNTKFSKNIAEISPERIHTFTTGLIVLDTCCDFFEIKTITTSSKGVREGFLSTIL